MGVGPEPARPLRARVPLAVASSSPPASLRASQSLRSQHGVCRPSARALVLVLGSGCCHHGLPFWEDGADWSLLSAEAPGASPGAAEGKTPPPRWGGAALRPCLSTAGAMLSCSSCGLKRAPEGLVHNQTPGTCAFDLWGRGSLQMCIHEESHGEISLGCLCGPRSNGSVRLRGARGGHPWGRRPHDDGGRGSTGQEGPSPKASGQCGPGSP